MPLFAVRVNLFVVFLLPVAPAFLRSLLVLPLQQILPEIPDILPGPVVVVGELYFTVI